MRWLFFVVLTATAAGAGETIGPAWQLEAPKAGWKERDSQGEAVFRDQLWILGGWFDSFHSPPRDVWRSADGKSWTQVTEQAPWRHSDLPMTLVFNDRLWLMGGWTDGRLPTHGASNEVWSTTDGVQWEQVTASAGWSPRLAAGTVVFQDQMWILGGTENYYFGDDRSCKNDAWKSADGKHWTQVAEHAPWSPRAYLQAVVLGDTLYVIAGGDYVPRYQAFNDVWATKDGIHWEQRAEHAPFAPRLWFSATAYRKRIFVLGGWSNQPARNWGDVWVSADGRSWTELKSPTIWKARHEHSAFVFRDQLWIAGGHAQPLSSEVWSLKLPEDWDPK